MASGLMNGPDLIRAAATVILVRHDGAAGPRLLMGQRGASAAFMPSKYVFPGGAVDPGDHGPLAMLDAVSRRCLADDTPGPETLIGAALRELREETGQHFRADAAPMRLVFRAITPPGRSRRFDARFFLADANAIAGDPEDFSGAEDELSHLHWVSLRMVRALDLPFITEVVLSEVALILSGGEQPGVPFFDNSGPRPTFRRLAA